MKNKELLRDILALIVLSGLIIIFHNFILNNLISFGIACLFFGSNLFIVIIHERKYKKNFPYKPYRSKKKIAERVLIGFLAGLHYIFLIWTYNHKKYNTQVDYPETLECVFGNISQMMILIFYLFVSVNLFKIIGYYSFLFMVLPIVTNFINIIVVLNKRDENPKI